MATATDSLTREWIRNRSDELAAENGCRFDGERGQAVVDWIEDYCRLYEGEFAGQPLLLKDWQYEVTMRLFGWVKWSDDWGREVRRFRRGGVWVPKKNTKSPTLAGWGLYLLCGDGEQGQKVYSVAKDGKQAMISHTHAIEMVRRSPDLSSECTVNKSTGQITHEPTRSFYKVVAGDNERSQEGLNGSVMVDETHVVDVRLMKILRGAGISRSEPMHVEVSTAGNNPDGYGKSQRDYGVQVASGDVEDESFFFQEYAAPQDLTDEELENNLVEIGRAANPTWGRIVREAEFVSDYQRSRRSLTDLLDFKMYRLNIWQSSDNPWLRSGDWAACKQDFTEDDLAGQKCWAGLDLSKTRDMSALVLVFPEEDPEAFRVLPYFWLPEETAVNKNHLAPFLSWSKSGHLELTPGAVLDYGFIRAKFRKLAKKFRIIELAYDPRFAEETTQTLEQGVTDDTGKILEEGTGVERFTFEQSLKSFAGPVADFERAVISGKLHHNGHPILNWQAGHVKVRTDANRNKMPVKPTQDDVKKIDGIIGAIMPLARAKLRSGDGRSIYEEAGNMSL